MSNTTIGPGAKKETIYNGPSPQPREGTVSSRPSSSPVGGTVYGGLTPGTNGGTVYGGPAAGGTVYSPSQPAPAPRASSATNPGATKGAASFFLIAGFSALNIVLVLTGSPIVLALGLTITKWKLTGAMGPALALSAIAIGLFVLIGVFAHKGSKAAFVFGLLLYLGDTALIFVSGGAALHIPSIIVHAVFLFTIFQAFRQIEG